MAERSRLSLFQIIGPGILLAATGIGAGDLLTGTLAGSAVGPSLLWAVVAGVLLKWALSEGVARWQLATESTVIEGWACRLGRWFQWGFLAYLLLFTLVVGGALVSACGVAGTGFLQLGADSNLSKIIWGIVHSMVALAFVWYGSFELFEKLISVCIGIMFVTVVTTALLTRPDWSVVAAGLIPSIPEQGRGWLIALVGGIGGTVTLLSYGYWIREESRQGLEYVKICRLDLACGYVMTALFGCSVVIIGSRVNLAGQGATLALQLADQLALSIGDWGRPFFLLGFWGTVFASMLGVWQSIPYMFADFVELRRGLAPGAPRHADLRKSPAYRVYLVIIATVPILFLWTPVQTIQLTYGVIGALFLPVLALTLLIMNNRRQWVGSDFRTPWPINVILAGGLAFFAYVGGLEIRDLLFGTG
jgi:Mn2+/Fe2+ NRAMP family transporter